MRAIGSIRKGSGHAAEIDQAESALALALLAAVTPLLLRWVLNALAASVMGAPGTAGAALRSLLAAAAVGVHHLGVAILAVVMLACLLRAAAEARASHGPAPEPSAWAVGEAYTAAAVIAALGLVVLWFT